MKAFLKCGDLHEGFARVRCPDCHHEMFVAFSCKQRCTCPSCHQKRALLTSIHVAEEVCAPVAHRHVVLTIPKRLRLHTRFDRTLLGKLCTCVWTCRQAEVRRLLGRQDVVPGMVAAIQTFGELLHWHPHFYVLQTCGAFTPQGEFLEQPELDLERLQAAWQEAVFALYLVEDKIEPEVIENMRSWPHSGFSVDQSVFLPAGDRAGIERLVGYMTRCPFSLSRLVQVTKTGQVSNWENDSAAQEPRELWFVDEGTFWATFYFPHRLSGERAVRVCGVTRSGLPTQLDGASPFNASAPYPRCFTGLPRLGSGRWSGIKFAISYQASRRSRGRRTRGPWT